LPIAPPEPPPVRPGFAVTRVSGVVAIAAVLAVLGVYRTLPRPKAEEAREAAIADTVQRLFTEYTRALSAGDLERAARFYADDPRFAWYEDGVERFDSRADVLAGLNQARASGAARLRFTNPQITVLDPWTAVLATTFRRDVAGSGEGEPASRGMITITLVRELEGWRFLVGHSSRQP
jgi:ketosteroid isomerase-like protein